MATAERHVRWFETLGIADVPIVGGKNASLGEMSARLGAAGVRVPPGFATTAEAYWHFLRENRLDEAITEHVRALESGEATLEATGKAIRRLISSAPFPADLAQHVTDAYRELGTRLGVREPDVAVRSSATAEDLPDASFAGQQETFLNVHGEPELLDAMRDCFASLFTDRAIAYRTAKGFAHMEVALSVGVQKMVRSDLAGSGVAFTIDTETGFPDVVVINAAYGLGEMVVKGAVNPDEYTVFKPLLDDPEHEPIIDKHVGEKERKMVYATGGSATTKVEPTTAQERRSYVLSDEEIVQLARWGRAIERHYDRPMDIEWAKDGHSGDLFIVQARPETVQAQKIAGALKSFRLTGEGDVLVEGLAIGEAVATGKVQVLKSAAEIGRFEDGSILVTGMTDPDWVPIMQRAAGIVTDHGGRTCHAAIVSRELGIPSVVGTSTATQVLKDGQEVTLSCAEGERGRIYRGILPFEVTEVDVDRAPATRTRVMLNIASPEAAFRWWKLPCRGIGLARMEFIINNVIKIHPMALVKFDRLQDQAAKQVIADLTRGYDDKREYFVEHLARGIAKIAASQYPEPVIVRMSDFKTNEYADLIGGRELEPVEANPMLGFRGASRYYSEAYRDGFALECAAIRRVRDEIGLTNVVVMIPFCRTLEEADQVLAVMAENGLKRGDGAGDGHPLEVYVMAEIPSNIVLVDEFSQRFDGFSIGSNDLTQLVLGVDRDSGGLSGLFDERNEAVKRMIRDLIEGAHRHGRKVGICGQAPSDYPEFTAFLVEAGIDSISLNPDSIMAMIDRVARTEEQLQPVGAPA